MFHISIEERDGTKIPMCIRNANGFDRHCCSRILFGANNWMWIHANEMDETIENCRFNLMRLELLFRIASHYLSIYLFSTASPCSSSLYLSLHRCFGLNVSLHLRLYDIFETNSYHFEMPNETCTLKHHISNLNRNPFCCLECSHPMKREKR